MGIENEDWRRSQPEVAVSPDASVGSGHRHGGALLESEVPSAPAAEIAAPTPTAQDAELARQAENNRSETQPDVDRGDRCADAAPRVRAGQSRRSRRRRPVC